MANYSEQENPISDNESNESEENDDESIGSHDEINKTISSKRQRAESDDKGVRTKRLRKRTSKFGTNEYEKNDDDFFEDIVNQNAAISRQELVDVEKEKSFSNETPPIDHEFSPGERIIIKYLKELIKDVKIVQSLVADIQLERASATKGYPMDVTATVETSLLDELGLPISELKQFKDFEENLSKHDFRKKDVSYSKRKFVLCFQ